jgi:hypothetical protein
MFYKVAFSSNALGKIIYCEMKFQLKNTMLPIHHEANGRCKYGISYLHLTCGVTNSNLLLKSPDQSLKE